MSDCEKQLNELTQIILYEQSMPSINFIRPLSIFQIYISHYYKFADAKFKRRGLAVCHGHNYNNDITSKIKFVKNWYYINANRETYPDYIADVQNNYAMSYFPDNYFDCVLSIYCPIASFDYNNYLQQLRRILNKSTKICGIFITELPGLFFHFISENEYNDLINEIHNLIPNNELILFRNRLNQVYKSVLNDKEFYADVIVNYNSHSKFVPSENKNLAHIVQFNEFIRKTALIYTKKILQHNNLKLTAYNKSFIIAQPITLDQ